MIAIVRDEGHTKMQSGRGNPRNDNLLSILKAIGEDTGVRVEVRVAA